MSQAKPALRVIVNNNPQSWSEIKGELDKVEDAKRPFRLWHPGDGKFMQWRYYSHLRNAHLGALIESRWAPVGTTIEVIDLRTHKQWGSYTRRIKQVEFDGGDNIPKHLA